MKCSPLVAVDSHKFARSRFAICAQTYKKARKRRVYDETTAIDRHLTLESGREIGAGIYIPTYVDVVPRLDLVHAFSRDSTNDRAPTLTTARGGHEVSSKRPCPVGTPRSTLCHRHRTRSNRRCGSWVNTRCRPTVRASRRCNRPEFHRCVSIAAFCLTFQAKLVAVLRSCLYIGRISVIVVSLSCTCRVAVFYITITDESIGYIIFIRGIDA